MQKRPLRLDLTRCGRSRGFSVVQSKLFGVAGHLIEHGATTSDQVVAVRGYDRRDATVDPDLGRGKDNLADLVYLLLLVGALVSGVLAHAVSNDAAFWAAAALTATPDWHGGTA